MSLARPGVLRAGDRIRFAGMTQTVVGLSGTAVRLADETGAASVVRLAHLLGADGFALLEERVGRVPLPPVGLLEGLPARVVERARWWERHVVEVLTGLPPQPDPDIDPDIDPGATPKPEYDPATRSLRQRELAKVAELRRAGHKVGLTTLKRLLGRYEAQGLWGLVDRRATRPSPGPGRVDARVVAAVGQALAEATDRSTGTVGRLRRRVEQLLAAEHGPGAVAMPSQATFYRLVARASRHQHTFGSARTRRSLAKRPRRPFGTVTAARPGELMQIDSTPLDVAVVLDDGVSGRVELTGMVDLATRSITAAVLRPTTKAVDASLLLARTLTPEPMRPGWPEALRMARSVLPHRSLLAVDERLAHAAARPVIVPETIVCDRGSVYVSQAFRSACRSLGISYQPAHPDTPTDRGVIERTLQSVGTLFCQFVAGYVGSSVERRGERAAQQAVWSLAELQGLRQPVGQPRGGVRLLQQGVIALLAGAGQLVGGGAEDVAEQVGAGHAPDPGGVQRPDQPAALPDQPQLAVEVDVVGLVVELLDGALDAPGGHPVGVVEVAAVVVVPDGAEVVGHGVRAPGRASWPAPWSAAGRVGAGASCRQARMATTAAWSRVRAARSRAASCRSVARWAAR